MFVKLAYQKGVVDLKLVPTDKEVADLFTKAVDIETFVTSGHGSLT